MAESPNEDKDDLSPKPQNRKRNNPKKSRNDEEVKE